MPNTQTRSIEVDPNPKATPDLSTIQWGLELRFGSRPESSLIEMRIPKAKQGDLGLVTLSGFFANNPAGREQLALQAFELSKREDIKAVYVTINGIRPGAKTAIGTRIAQKGHATADCDIDYYRELLIDVDVRDEIRHGASSTREEKAQAYDVAETIGEYLTELGIDFDWIDSGNGYHLLPALDLPNTPENANLISAVLLALDKKFSNATAQVDVGMFNPSRISKLAGTVVRKGVDSKDRPWRTSTIVATAPGKKPVTRVLLVRIAGISENSTPVSVVATENTRALEGKIEAAKQTMENFLSETGVSYWRPHVTADGRTVYPSVCPRGHGHHSDECTFQITLNGGFAFQCHHNTCTKILADAREAAKDPSLSAWSLIRHELQQRLGKSVPMTIEGFEPPPAPAIFMDGKLMTDSKPTQSSAPEAEPPVVDDPFETLQSNPTQDFMELLRRSRLKKQASSWLSQHAQMPHELQASVDEWLVDRMIRRRGVSLWAAEQGSFKSILSLFLASALMQANKNNGDGVFLGRKVQTIFQKGDSRPIVVYYIDNDSPKSLTKKNCLRIGINAETNNGTFKIYGAYMDDPVTTLDDPRLVEAAKRERAFFIVDTLSKVFEQLKENDPVDANYVMTKATRLAYASEGVLILHHDAKDGTHGYRGSTPIVAVPDMCFALSRKKDTNVATFREIRFKDVESYYLQCEMFFESTVEKNGSFTISNQYRNKVIADSLLDSSKSKVKSITDPKNYHQEIRDREFIQKARLAIEAGAAAGKPAPSQCALAKEIGLKGNSAKERILCASLPEDPRPWRVERGERNAIVFLPVEKKATTGSSNVGTSNDSDHELMPGFEDAA